MSTTELGFLGLLFSGVLALLAGVLLARLHWRPDLPPYGRRTRWLDVTLHPERYVVVDDAPLRVIRSLNLAGALLLASAAAVAAYGIVLATLSP
jgi:hypothetical protein